MISMETAPFNLVPTAVRSRRDGKRATPRKKDGDEKEKLHYFAFGMRGGCETRNCRGWCQQ
jgi:hypothetical protein